MHFFLRATVAISLSLIGCPIRAADVEHGKALYAACLGCHTEKPEALGPSLRGIVGRKSASLDDFRYSGPMKRADLTWDEANLKDFIVSPQTKVKGNRMPFGGLGNSADADDLVAYLKTLE
jgi:cytochrome c